MRRMLLLAGMFLTTYSGIAQQRIYTLDECKALALRNNLKLQSARLDVEGAEETKREAFTKYFPTIAGSASGFKADKGALGISVLNGWLSTSFVDRGVMAGVTAVQPLFTGGQIINGNKLAKVNSEVKKEELRQSENETSSAVEQYYWQLVSLREKLKTIDLVSLQIDTICRDVKVAVDAGIAMRNDLLQAELQRNKIASSRLKVTNGLQVVKLLLAQSMELPADSFDIAPVDLGSLPSPDDCFVDHQSALYNTVSYRLLEKNVEASRLQRQIEIGKRMPTIGIGAGYMYYKLPDSHTIRIFEEDRAMGMVFATVAVPISDWWGGTHAIRKKNIEVKMAEYAKQSNGELLLTQMQQLWNELVELYSQVIISKESVDKATENARLNSDYYHAGTVSVSDWLDAQSLLQQSRDQYTEDVTNYLMKRTHYLQATGR